MKRITFVENRGKTAFWVRVADAMVLDGHEVSWIVQNPAYAPRVAGQRVIQIPFPKKKDLENNLIPDSVITDRGRTYFGAGQRHYAYYRKYLEAALTELAPDVVIGEPTLFHELLTIEICRKRGIPYLHPTMNRYPSGRFMILDGDTQNPVLGSREVWDDSTISSLAHTVVSGKSLPSYMRAPNGIEKQMRHLRLVRARLRTAGGRIKGEIYNTPSIVRKLNLGRKLRSNLKAWGSLQRAPGSSGPVVLYPLQMQPEANIDVWGRPFSNQVEVIKRILGALPENGQVAIKANPKSKYEVSDGLIALAHQEPRVVLLPLDWRMPRAHEVTTGAVTVSGTVGYEAIFNRGRCVSLRHPIIQDLFPSCHANTPESAVQRLLSDPLAGKGSLEATKSLLSELVSCSFEGTINEPVYDPDCVSDKNISLVYRAFTKVLSAIKTRDFQE